MKKIQLDLQERSYEILVGKKLLDDVASLIAPVLPQKKVIIVTDENVAKLYLDKVKTSLENGGVEAGVIILPAGESTKSLDNFEILLDKIFAFKPERKTTLLALGGGVIGDITGFAASVVLRGVPFIQLPTTLLAQVDSSVGGKTGINNSFGKNLIGSFYQPLMVVVDITTLKTLPEREYLAGYAEVVKYGLINNLNFFELLDANIDRVKGQDLEFLIDAVIISCEAKAKIVAEDEKEGGKRALLNLGHTFGHALEKECGYSGKLLHGEAVAVGMVMAYDFSVKIGKCSSGDAKRVKEHLQNVGLRTSIKQIEGEFEAGKLLEYMSQDKKVSDGKMVFILASAIGASYIAKDVVKEDVNNFLQGLLNG